MLKNHPTVVLFQYRLFHYRAALFELLRDSLEREGVRFELVYGQPFGKEKLKRDEGSITWGRQVKNLYFPIVEKKDLCWQPLPRSIDRPDMVIFMQENRLLANYYWMMRGRFTDVKTAFWGHGRNFQSPVPGGLRERWKRVTVGAVDWWFAYTSMTVEVLRESGFPDDRITLLNNSIDTEGFRQDIESVKDEEIAALRSALKIGSDAIVGLFCGSIYPDKKPELMIQAADIIRARIPNFHFLVVGDGQSAPRMRAAAASRPWMHCVGPAHGLEKARYFKIASFVVNPGALGLHVLDSFTSGLPIITTVTARHGPEIAYLEEGKTGFSTPDSPAEYAASALSLIQDPSLLQDMRQACLEASRKYTVTNMAERFTEGIVRCLHAR